ncbi:OsmC family protein [Flocculibacter collagenilyticus]|uniref:OsmC family protein n=1 Tax=Flocculibacter collagenilyticus TaxID=2744479 RepID=UPI0018F42530|nr:OsmC family protein [Flocculibacter collagenilyticus]
MRNSIPLSALSEFTNEVKALPEEGVVQYGVELNWESGTRSRAKALPMAVGPHVVSRDFEWTIDEPRQLMGSNHAPNPQEYLLSGLGACILVGFTVGASIMEIQLESLKVTVQGELNLAGFLGVDSCASVGFKRINYQIDVSGTGTDEQFELLRKQAVAHSPNAMSMMNGVEVCGELTVHKH